MDSSSAPTSPLIFGSDSYLDLGNFQNVISDHEISRPLTLGLGIGINSRSVPTLRRLSHALVDVLESASLRFTFDAAKNGAAKLSSIDLYLDENSPPAASYRVTSQHLNREQLLRSYPLSQRMGGHARVAEANVLELVHLDLGCDLVTAALAHFTASLSSTRESLSQSPDEEMLEELSIFELDDAQAESFRNRTAARREEAQWWQDRLSNYNSHLFREDYLAYCKTRLLIADRFLPAGSLGREATKSTDIAFEEYGLNRLVARNRPAVASASPFPPMIDITQILGAISIGIAREFEDLTYVGPLREFPERNYIFSAGGEKTVGLRGENLPNILFNSPDRISELNRLAALMDLGYEVSLHRSLDPDLDNVFAVRLIDQVTRAKVGISDVGFGVSQILPILLQCALRAKGCIVMEQPEIHLNPKLQANLAEVFASSVQGGRRQLIVETHSEHLLLRLQKLIREGRFESKLLSVIYVSKHGSGSAVMPITIDPSGNRLTPWPDGFFDDTYRELFEAAE
jgi:hypothetical protein